MDERKPLTEKERSQKITIIMLIVVTIFLMFTTVYFAVKSTFYLEVGRTIIHERYKPTVSEMYAHYKEATYYIYYDMHSNQQEAMKYTDEYGIIYLFPIDEKKWALE